MVDQQYMRHASRTLNRRCRQAECVRMANQFQCHVCVASRVQYIIRIIQIDFRQHCARRKIQRVRKTAYRRSEHSTWKFVEA